MKTKKKNILRLLIALVVVIGVMYASLPYYARQALIHWMPVIDDLETFHRHTVHHNPDDVWHWPLSADYNRYQLAEKDAHYLDSLRTVSFLVIRRDSIVFENYRDGWNDTLTSNIFLLQRPSWGCWRELPLTKERFIVWTTPYRATYLPIQKECRLTSPCAIC